MGKIIKATTEHANLIAAIGNSFLIFSITITDMFYNNERIIRNVRF